MATPVYVFDIDGTLADCSHRLHHIQKDPKDWAAFFAACADDKPIKHIIDLAIALDQHRDVVFVSGRSDECRLSTEAWLAEHVFNYRLYMRKAGDHRDDDVVKLELLAELRADGFEPIMAFEDRARVVKAFRDAGVPVAQVAPGDF